MPSSVQPQWSARRLRVVPLLADDVRVAWVRTPTSPQFWAFLAAATTAVGIALMVGAPARVSSAAFIAIRQYGGPVTWGAGFAVIGVAIFAAPFAGARYLMLALAAAALLYLLLAAGFLVAVLTDLDAALLGPIFALIPAGLYALHARHYRRAVTPPIRR